MRKLLVFINLLLVLLILGLAFYWEPAAPEAPTAPQPTGGDFTLTGPQGQASLRDFSGRMVLLTFGYTFCPDICPTTLVIWSQVLNQLSAEELRQMQPLFISVDPERDTPARLAEYSTFFHPAILGLSGSPEHLRAVTASYGAVFARQENASAGGYVIDHTAQSYLLDRQGRLVERIAHATPPEQLLALLRKQLSTHQGATP